MSRVKKFSVTLTIFVSLLTFVIGAALGFCANYLTDKQNNPIFKSDVVYGEGISFHFLELGNGKTGDSIFIQTATTDILVDAGSRTNSASTIESYVKDKMTDDVLEFVIATHADQDHIACFAGDNTNPSLFKRFEVATIIDFPKTNKELLTEKGNDTVYGTYVKERDAEVGLGAKHFNALDCYNNVGEAKRSYDLGGNVTLNILYNYFYDHEDGDENNYSVCFQIEDGDSKFLFTGDLEAEGEEKLVQNNTLSKVKLFKAGHHGSPTSSNDCLLSVIQPEICVACCCAGSVEYTDNLANTFPSQAFIDRISNYTTQVFVPTVGTIVEDGTKKDGSINYEDVSFASLNGNIVVTSKKGNITVECSNNNTVLKDTTWFKTYRTTPTAWA